MNIEILPASDSARIEELSLTLNEAFKGRRSDRIPYEQITSDNLTLDIMKSENSGCGAFAMVDRGDILGGLCCKYLYENGTKTAKIFHLGVCPKNQGNGIARALIEYLENRAREDEVKYVQLDVANIAFPAKHLYESMGYKPYKIYANVPGTYYFIRYIKQLLPYCGFELKRKRSLFVSKIKFFILFREDSTPNWLHRMIYGNNR